MNRRIGVVGIVIEDPKNVSDKVNAVISEHGQIVIGRMGVPYKDKDINVISIIVDAPQDVISAMSGKIGMIPEVSTKTIYPPLPQ